ncbi:MAG: Ig domain-containing protein [Balneolaceae bacterium]|nr:Ig domain-containing protein [Balneolaceae bacterium]
MKSINSYFFLLLFLSGITLSAQSQPQLQKDLTFVMEIPSVMAMESSKAHMYVLSDSEGMVVFRTKADSLQWLYSSTGMEQRGNTITTDIRFAYLFGYNKRLTVLEPTSVLGVYSSTLLPEKPLDASRIGQHLYIALGTKGLGKISLRTPVSVDSAITFVEQTKLNDDVIIDLESSYDQLFVLSANGTLYVFNQTDEGVSLSKELSMLRDLNRLFLVDEILMGTDEQGNIYEIDNSGELSKLGSIGESVKKIAQWNDWLIIKGTSKRVWTSYQNRAPVLWKENPDAGNYFTVSEGNLWLSEFNKISKIISGTQPIKTSASKSAADSSTLKLSNIENQVVPYPKPLILSLNLATSYPSDKVQFSYQSDIENAKIKGSGFYWQPLAEQVGTHQFKIIATAADGQSDSTKFSVEVRSFNAPPRFTPLRPISIPIGEEFTLPIKAIDSDGMNRNLVRYLGVDLPEGASIDEQTGKFVWQPTERQVGENTFRVIATDQYGAASSIDVSIRVVSASRESDSEN